MSAIRWFRRWCGRMGFGVCGVLAARLVLAQTPTPAEDFAEQARTLRESALRKIEPPALGVATIQLAVETRYPWKNNIVTTVFWVSAHGASAWDAKWAEHFGGFDNPKPSARKGFIPAAFVPKQNPFYCSLPYNDVAEGATKPEARVVIPWFQEAFTREGISVCHDRWVRIRNRNSRDCYAQWSDCGPFRTDHFEYVFGDERPKPNANQGAGLGISPAVRDYLAASSTDVMEWKFVDFKDVPRGPWSNYGENNPFLQQAKNSSAESKPTPAAASAPTPPPSPEK